MFFFYTYLVCLFIAPQLWLPPFVGWRPDLLLYPAWAIWALMSGRLGKLRFGPADGFFVLFIGWIAVSIALSDTRWYFFDIVFLYYGKWFVLYILIRATLQDATDLRRGAAFMVFLLYILVIEGIDHKNSPDGLNWAGQRLGWVDDIVTEAGGTGRIRWVGVFDGIGSFCVAYNIALPFVLTYASVLPNAFMRWFNRLGLLALCLAIYYTGSRGGFLASLSIISLFLAIKFRVSIKGILIAATVVVTAYMLAPTHLTQTTDSHKSAENRVDVWAQGLMMVTARPIVGVGRGNFKVWTGKLIAHNSAIEIVGETGVVGLLLWGSLITAAFRMALLRYRAASEPMDKAVLRALMLAVIGYMVASMFVTLELETFYLLLALCMGNDRRITESPYRKREFLLVVGLVVAFVLMMKIFVTLYF